MADTLPWYQNAPLIVAYVGIGGLLADKLLGAYLTRRNSKDGTKVQTITATATVVKAEAEAEKLEADVEINTLDHAEKYALKLWEVRNQLITVNEQVLQLNRKVQELETDLDIERGQLTLCQQERLELSRELVIAQEAEGKWRLAALAQEEYLLCLTEKREDVDFYRTTAEMRLQEAYRFSEARAAAALKKEEFIGTTLPIDVKGKGESVGSESDTGR